MLVFLAENLAAPLSFFVLFRLTGPKWAIAAAALISGVQLVRDLHAGSGLKPLLLVASGFTIGFGALDLVLTSPRFFRYEPALQNAFLGLAFLVSLGMERPLIERFAQSLPERFRPEPGPVSRRYLRRLTSVWAVYFAVKATFFLHLAHTVTLDRLVVLRSIVGGLSLVAMIGGEILFRSARGLLRRPGTRPACELQQSQ